MAGALWDELRSAEYVGGRGGITPTGFGALREYRAERDKDAPKPAAKPCSQSSLDDLRRFRKKGKQIPGGSVAELLEFGYVVAVAGYHKHKMTQEGFDALDAEFERANPRPEPECEFVQLKGHMPAFPETKPDGVPVQHDGEAPAAYAERLVRWLVPAGTFKADKAPSVSEPIITTAELVLRIQYEECVRLARLLKSDLAWVEVGKREAELKALRGE